MTDKDPSTMTIDEVRDELIKFANARFRSGSQSKSEVLKLVFDSRIAEAQTNAAAQQAAAAAQQAKAAQGLNRVTWALFTVAFVQAALIVVQILVSLKAIGR